MTFKESSYIEVKQILDLRSRGYSIREIGKLIDLSYGSVYYHLKKHADTKKFTNQQAVHNKTMRRYLIPLLRVKQGNKCPHCGNDLPTEDLYTGVSIHHKKYGEVTIDDLVLYCSNKCHNRANPQRTGVSNSL